MQLYDWFNVNANPHRGTGVIRHPYFILIAIVAIHNIVSN